MVNSSLTLIVGNATFVKSANTSGRTPTWTTKIFFGLEDLGQLQGLMHFCKSWKG